MYATLCGEILVSRVSKGIENRRPIARARSTAPYNLSLFACDIFGIRSILFSTARLTSAISGKEMSRLIGDPAHPASMTPANSEKRNAGADIRPILRAPALAWHMKNYANAIHPRLHYPKSVSAASRNSRSPCNSTSFRRLDDALGAGPQANRVNHQSKAMPRPAA